jgi:hypothetical protein
VNSEKYIGLDVHQATISVAVLDSTGKLIMESILETKAATILQFFAGRRTFLWNHTRKSHGARPFARLQSGLRLVHPRLCCWRSVLRQTE